MDPTPANTHPTPVNVPVDEDNNLVMPVRLVSPSGEVVHAGGGGGGGGGDVNLAQVAGKAVQSDGGGTQYVADLAAGASLAGLLAGMWSGGTQTLALAPTSSATSRAVKATAGRLCQVFCTTGGSLANTSIVFYDNAAAASGTIIGIIGCGSATNGARCSSSTCRRHRASG